MTNSNYKLTCGCITTGHKNEVIQCPTHKAAPEMLEALKYVVQYHREHDSGEGELFGLDFVTSCIAAISKVEGRS